MFGELLAIQSNQSFEYKDVICLIPWYLFSHLVPSVVLAHKGPGVTLRGDNLNINGTSFEDCARRYIKESQT